MLCFFFHLLKDNFTIRTKTIIITIRNLESLQLLQYHDENFTY